MEGDVELGIARADGGDDLIGSAIEAVGSDREVVEPAGERVLEEGMAALAHRGGGQEPPGSFAIGGLIRHAGSPLR